MPKIMRRIAVLLTATLAVATSANAALYAPVKEHHCDATGHCVDVSVAVETNGSYVRAVGNIRCLSASGTYPCFAVLNAYVYLEGNLGTQVGFAGCSPCGTVDYFSTPWAHNPPTSDAYYAYVHAEAYNGFAYRPLYLDVWSGVVLL
jgi:hypothetical protein